MSILEMLFGKKKTTFTGETKNIPSHQYNSDSTAVINPVHVDYSEPDNISDSENNFDFKGGEGGGGGADSSYDAGGDSGGGDGGGGGGSD